MHLTDESKKLRNLGLDRLKLRRIVVIVEPVFQGIQILCCRSVAQQRDLKPSGCIAIEHARGIPHGNRQIQRGDVDTEPEHGAHSRAIEQQFLTGKSGVIRERSSRHLNILPNPLRYGNK